MRSEIERLTDRLLFEVEFFVGGRVRPHLNVRAVEAPGVTHIKYRVVK